MASTASTGTAAPAAAGTAPLWIVRLAGAWVLAGALAKAISGSPAELPAPILAMDLDPVTVVVLAVAVETVVAALALAVPRVGWAPVSALLGLFTTLLVGHMRSGLEHCGCFGGALAMPAWLMLAIDGALLVAVLAAAWRCGLHRFAGAWTRVVPLSAAIGLAAAIALSGYAESRLAPLRPREARDAQRGPKAPTAPGPGPAATGPATATAPVPVAPAWSLPATFPDLVILRPIQWKGHLLEDTELGRWTDTSKFPKDATLLIYYLSCSHCAEHLAQLADRQQADPASAPTYVLVQLPTPRGYTGEPKVHRVPTAALHVVLPAEVGAYQITPPWDVVVEGGRVTKAERILWPGEKH